MLAHLPVAALAAKPCGSCGALTRGRRESILECRPGCASPAISADGRGEPRMIVLPPLWNHERRANTDAKAKKLRFTPLSCYEKRG